MLVMHDVVHRKDNVMRTRSVVRTVMVCVVAAPFAFLGCDHESLPDDVDTMEIDTAPEELGESGASASESDEFRVGTCGVDPGCGITCSDPVTNLECCATVVGTNGADVIWAQSGDVIVARGGNDVVYTDFARSALICANEGSDYVGNSNPFATTFGAFRIRAGEGADSVQGGSGNDVITGGPGNDVLDARAGHDSVNGQEGSDVCVGESLSNCEG